MNRKRETASQTKKNKWNKGKKWILLTLALLVVLEIVLGESFARYRSEAQLEINTAGTAAYAISAGAESIEDLLIDCESLTDNTAAYRFWVNNSRDDKVTEVAVSYSVQVELGSVLPDSIFIQLDGMDGTAEDGRVYTFESPDWKFAAGVESTANHTLTFTAVPTDVEEDFTISSVVLTVMAEQIG